MEYELIRQALNHSSGGGVTSQYIITRVETLRPVFQAVADGYHTYHDPTWRIDDEQAAPARPLPQPEVLERATCRAKSLGHVLEHRLILLQTQGHPPLSRVPLSILANAAPDISRHSPSGVPLDAKIT